MYRQAWRDLWRRYREVFQHAWRQRREMEPPQRLPHEAVFLPATLALQETPVHPAPRIAMGAILLFAALALLWALLGHMDVVATATGKVVPDSRSKVIQPVDTATVRAIRVRDGEVVRAGQALIDLDATEAQADVERLHNDLLTAHYVLQRSAAMLVAMDTWKTPTLTPPPGAAADTARFRQEAALLQGQYSELLAQVEQLEAEIVRREAERRATQAIAEKLQQTLPIVRQRAEDYKDLLTRNFVSKHGYLQMEQSHIELERDWAAQREKLAEIKASRLEAERQKARLIAETRRSWLDRQHEAGQQAVTLEQELVKAENRGRLTRLTAPEDGIVQQLAVHTIGGVVTEAQPLMVIVPLENPLEVEAFILNKDIGFVRPGQAARIKVETFTFTKYGTLDGEVVHVSSDAIQDDKLGLIFSTRIRLHQDTLKVGEKNIRLSPGMAVTVEVKTASRRVIEYFLGPLIQYTDESLKER